MNKRTLQSLILGIAIGLAVGLGVYTFVYAKGASYLMNDPASCANCHIMKEQYDGWLKSSHRAVATCNDCHTPANFLGKYATKASNGFCHSFYFTTGGFHEPIQIKKRNLEMRPKKSGGDLRQTTDSLNICGQGSAPPLTPQAIDREGPHARSFLSS
jgi:cytochrome c nitrite reductase small subunit